MNTHHIWIDLDTGVDDTSALICACALEKRGLLSIEGISAVCGNNTLPHTFENTRNVLNAIGRPDIPVFPGAEKPLNAELQTSTHVHGENGLSNVILEPSPQEAKTLPAWEAIYECAKSFSGSLELILTAPHTNAAIALRKHPDLKRHLKRILIMGGGIAHGNVTPFAEFNILVDPEAADIVFSSGIPIVMCGLDVTEKTVLSPAKFQELGSLGTVSSRLFFDVTENYLRFYQGNGTDGVIIHDICPVLYTVRPELFTAQTHCVRIDTGHSETRGRTYLSDEDAGRTPHVSVVTDADKESFLELFKLLLADY